MSRLKVGEKVILKLGGPFMLVSTVYDGVCNDGPIVECCYFDNNGVLNKCDIREACLDKVAS